MVIYNDGMVMFFSSSQGNIAIDGFSMVLPPLDHYHWMFLAVQNSSIGDRDLVTDSLTHSLTD